MATKKPTKKKMSLDLPPQSHEVLGTVALGLLGYEHLASVRKLKDLGEIEGRKIGRDWWYDLASIESYNERRRPVGRRPIEDDEDDDPQRKWMREYQRRRRAGQRLAAQKGASKKAGRGAKPSAGKGGRDSAGAPARGAGRAAKKSAAAKKRTPAKGRR